MTTADRSHRVAAQWGTCLLLLTAYAAGADDAQLPVAEAVRAPDTAKPLWEVGVAGAVGGFSDYPGSDHYRVRGLPVPYFIYRGGIFRSDASGPRLHKDVGNVEFEVSGGGTLSTNSQDAARIGMPKLDYLLESGPNAKITVAKPTATSRVVVDVPIRLAISTDFSSRLNFRGAVFAPDVVFEDQSLLGSKWSGRVGLGVEAATSQLQDYWYEVAPQYARPGRPAYQAHAGYLGSRLSVGVTRALTRNFTVFIATELDSYAGAENRDSPLMKSKTGTNVSLGFAWSLWQSQAREESTSRPPSMVTPVSSETGAP